MDKQRRMIMKKNVLIVVDMQNDFIDMALGTKEAKTIVSNVAEKIKEAAKKGDYVIVTKDTHNEKTYMASEEGKNLPVMHCIESSEGWNLNPHITEALGSVRLSNTHIIEKDTFGAYSLPDYLGKIDIHDHIENIELVGLCTDICVISNAVIAKTALPNAHIVVDAACCAGVTPVSHDTALNAMKALQIEVKNQGKEPWR